MISKFGEDVLDDLVTQPGNEAKQNWDKRDILFP